MEKLYKISSLIIAIITVIIFNIVFTDENDYSIMISFVAGIIVFGLSFLSPAISKKLINFGDKIKSKILKILYFVLALPFTSIVIFCILWFIISVISRIIPSQGILLLFVLIVVFICIALPCVQTLIVLILKHFIKIKNKK